MARIHQTAVLLVAQTVAAAACNARQVERATPRPDVLVSVREGTIVAPDSLLPGWTRIRVHEDRVGHIIVVFRLPAASSGTQVASFLAALDTAPSTPQPGVALGGPEIGETGDVVVHLMPGRYVFGCVSRGEDGHRHASAGEAKSIVVVQGDADSLHALPPRATEEVRMMDFAYMAAEKWASGLHMLRIENLGRQDHQLRLVRLLAGSSMKDWATADNPDEHGVPVAGMARVSPGEVAYLPADLSPGTYVAHCFVRDGASGRQHIELGMLRSIQVE